MCDNIIDIRYCKSEKKGKIVPKQLFYQVNQFAKFLEIKSFTLPGAGAAVREF